MASVDTMTITDIRNVPDTGEPATTMAMVPDLLRQAVDRTAAHQHRQRRQLQRIRVLVREQAAWIVAAVGPAALEIIAEFRARQWARTAAHRKDPIGGRQATARSAEWQRISASVSKLLA
jgi:sulfite reductase beta subunit-like hemoprotein